MKLAVFGAAGSAAGGAQPDRFYARPEESRETVEALVRDVTLSRRLGRRVAFKLISD